MCPSGISVDFYSATITTPPSSRILLGSTSITFPPGGSGSLVYQERNNLGGNQTVINPSMYYEGYCQFPHSNYTTELEGFWSANEQIYVNVKSSSTPLLSPELIFMVAGIVIGAGIVGSYFIIRTRKRPKPKTG
jgi:hypothetical protein